MRYCRLILLIRQCARMGRGSRGGMMLGCRSGISVVSSEVIARRCRVRIADRTFLSFFEEDGYCYMDIRLTNGAETGRLSLQRLAFGLLYVVDECVAHATLPRGGWVFNMGEGFPS